MFDKLFSRLKGYLFAWFRARGLRAIFLCGPCCPWVELPDDIATTEIPESADLMIVAGPMGGKRLSALRRLYDRMARPRWVIAFGACAAGKDAGGGSIPVDVYVPGCPPEQGQIAEAMKELKRLIMKASDARLAGLVRAPAADEALERTEFVDIPYGDAASFAPFGLKLGVEGARVSFAEVETGYAHRGIEKLAMSVPWHFAHGVAEKINCRSPDIAGVGYGMAVERLFGVSVPRRAMWLRMILCESWRACEHMLAVARSFSSIGLARQAAALMAEARGLAACVEACFGSRGHGRCVRIGGMARDLSAGDAARMEAVIPKVRREIERALRIAEKDRMFAARTRGVGAISQHAAEGWGITGPCLRATGSGRDLRKTAPYLLYAECDWEAPAGVSGDAFDRITVMLAEAIQSLRIIKQAIVDMEPGAVEACAKGITLPGRSELYGSEESRLLHEGMIRGNSPMPRGEAYSSTEASAGELGFYLVSDGKVHPAMFKVISPSFAICQAAPMILKGCMLEDVPIVIASLGASASEADR